MIDVLKESYSMMIGIRELNKIALVLDQYLTNAGYSCKVSVLNNGELSRDDYKYLSNKLLYPVNEYDNYYKLRVKYDYLTKDQLKNKRYCNDIYKALDKLSTIECYPIRDITPDHLNQDVFIVRVLRDKNGNEYIRIDPDDCKITDASTDDNLKLELTKN